MKLIIISLILIFSISCADQDNKIIDHLENKSVTLLDFGLYRLSKDIEIMKVSSDDQTYSLAGYARLLTTSDNKRVINIKIDNIVANVTYKSEPLNKSKAKLLCMDSIKYVRSRFHPMENYSSMNVYFSLDEKKGKSLDEAITITTIILYDEKRNALVSCSGSLLGKDIDLRENGGDNN